MLAFEPEFACELSTNQSISHRYTFVGPCNVYQWRID